MEGSRLVTAVRSGADPEVPILDVQGEIDIYTAPKFKQAVVDLLDQGVPRLVLNMQQVSYMDSSGFGTLLGATRRMKPGSGSIALVGCNESIERMLRITRLNTIFSLYQSEEDALRQLEESDVAAA